MNLLICIYLLLVSIIIKSSLMVVKWNFKFFHLGNQCLECWLFTVYHRR